MKLKQALKTLDSDMLLSDGGTTRSVENLLDVLEDADDDGIEYVIDAGHDGLAQVVMLDSGGWQITPPVYTEVGPRPETPIPPDQRSALDLLADDANIHNGPRTRRALADLAEEMFPDTYLTGTMIDAVIREFKARRAE